MIDTHTHLYLGDFGDPESQGAAVERALTEGVGHLVFPNVNVETMAPMLLLHEKYPEVTSVAMGLHPTELTDDWRREILPVEEALSCGGFVAIGEVGMDLYWDKTYGKSQMEAFAAQLRWGADRGLPVIIHQRDALPETLEVIAAHRGELPPLIFHSFTGYPNDVTAIRKVCDPWFGINGVATFKNAQSVRDALPVIGIDRMLLETDSPYLAPVPKRGRQNESAYLPFIRNVIASTLSLDPQEVESVTDNNAIELFALPIKT